MTVELAAVRLLAPWFGASSGVWTNVIGVILLALALGYLVGARLSRAARPGLALAIVLLLAGAFTVWLPAGAGPVADLFLPAELSLDRAAPLLVWGSLAASLFLFLPAALVLGCTPPLAVELVQRRRGGHAGDAGGRVLAASTLGSLAGTFGTTHVFLPRLGLEWTFLGAGTLLALSGALVLLLARRAGRERTGGATGAAALAVLALVSGLLVSRVAGRAGAAGEELLAAVESRYQSLRVIEVGEGSTRLRHLRVNESLDSFQSVWQPEPGLFPPGYYYDHFALPLHWATRADGPRAKWRVLILGLGAGSAVRVLEGVLPAGTELETVGVEIDPAVVELGERYFDLEHGPDREVLAGLDGRAALRTEIGIFDQVIVDAYANNMEIPPHLATREFFSEVAACLAPQGWLTVNVGGFGPEDPVVRAMAASACAGMDEAVHVLAVPFSRNQTLVVRRGGGVPTPGSRAWGPLPDEVDTLRPSLEIPGAWHVVRPEDVDPADVLTDDRNPIERLQLRSIEAAEERWAERS